MSPEKPRPIPQEHQLPLNIIKSDPLGSPGRESALYRAEVMDKNNEGKLIALKKIKKEEFSTVEEMKKSKAFYEYMKNLPGFGKFVPDTLYFIARETAQDSPRGYMLQKLIKGKRLDEFSDEELYSDPELVKQLLEFIDAAINVFEHPNKEAGGTPDLYGSKLAANILFNPRHTTNVLISENPDEQGNKIFFVDTNLQSQQKSGIGKSYQKNIGSKLQLKQLKRWRELVKSHLEQGLL